MATQEYTGRPKYPSNCGPTCSWAGSAVWRPQASTHSCGRPRPVGECQRSSALIRFCAMVLSVHLTSKEALLMEEDADRIE
ncbi:unnamed protein product [Jaminaea pallidilutea]